MVAKATAHPDRRLISSEDVEGTNVYGVGDKAIGEIHSSKSEDAIGGDKLIWKLTSRIKRRRAAESFTLGEFALTKSNALPAQPPSD
jgi:hypothetical protein